MSTILAFVMLHAFAGAQHPCMPAGMSHAEHMKQMQERGNTAMGFDQEKVAHHFRLLRSGGSIEVSAKDSADDSTRQQIRNHLRTIAAQFPAGDFAAPVATHAEEPPGVKTMRERRRRITYSYEETGGGARVLIDTKDRGARKAVHEFLRYQIREHATGDPVTVEN